jgi:NADPH:quinone reductase-like Zn-dependent oxidoreductase
MKAIVQDHYGSAEDVLELQETDKPTAKADEVLVRVHAASIHAGDCLVMQGLPKVMRPVFGLRRPKYRIPGTDVAGTVEALGADVTQFQPGDEVFGWCKGAFAEHVPIAADALALKPANLTFEQASAIGVSAFTALQGLRDKLKVQPGQKVLITGASGGVGTFAVQIAKSFGAEVTGVCSTRNVDMVRSIGADDVIDYSKEDFTQTDPKYDLILDNVGKRSLSDTRRPLVHSGTLLSSGAPVSGWFGGLGHVIKALVQSLYVRQQAAPFVSLPNKDDLATLKGLAEAGKIVPVIDQAYPLSDGAKAMAHVAEGHTQGKTVITVSSALETSVEKEMERETGFEPATSSLEGRNP